MKIEKKVWPEYFKEIKKGTKKFELRLADFQIKKGDTLILREWNPKTKEYTGRVLQKKVTFIIKTKDVKFWPKKEVQKYGLQVIGFK
jgi:ASC-1-like (ASCH) protein